MGAKYQKFINDLVQAARSNTGLALIEIWDCENCKAECFRVHPMEEVIACGNCGHRRASKLDRYRSACEIGADAEVEFRKPAYDPGEPH